MKELIKILVNEIKELNQKIDQLQTFKDNATCKSHSVYGCENSAQHSDGSNLWCSDCWENLHDPKYD